jgi:phage repressor protein C with HTH and peptisase S24 domain
LKAKEAEEKKLAKAKEAEEKKQAKEAEAEAKKLLKAKAVEDEKKADLKPELTMEAVEQLQATIAEEDDEEEEDIVLDASTPKVEIDGTEYYVTKAYGFPAVLFDEEGECIGAYDETTGEIQELSFEE